MLSNEQKQKVESLISKRFEAVKKMFEQTTENISEVQKNIDETKQELITQAVNFLTDETTSYNELQFDVSEYFDLRFKDLQL